MPKQVRIARYWTGGLTTRSLQTQVKHVTADVGDSPSMEKITQPLDRRKEHIFLN